MMNRFFQKIERGLNGLLGLMGLAGIAVMTLGVFTRYVLVIPLNWSDEFLRTMFVWSYFIGAAMLVSSGGLMRLELLDDFLSSHGHHTVKKVIGIFVELCMVGFFSFMTYYAFQLIHSYVLKGTTSSTSNVPAWVLILGMAIGFVLIVILSIRNIIQYLRRDDKPAE